MFAKGRLAAAIILYSVNGTVFHFQILFVSSMFKLKVMAEEYPLSL